MVEFYVTAFVTLFLIIDPIGLLPMFIALTQGSDAATRRAIAFRASAVALFLLALFAGVGEKLLTAIGIGMPAFRIAGGLLLFLTAVEMLFERRTARRDKHSEDSESVDPSVFPLATPLIAGPGSMAAAILLAGQDNHSINAIFLTILAVVSVLLVGFVLFMMSGKLEKILGKTAINVITRLLGMLLAALAVQFVVDGMRGLGVIS